MEGFDHAAGWVALPSFLSHDEVAKALSQCHGLLELAPDLRRAGDKPVAGTHHLVEVDTRSEFIAGLLERPTLVDTVEQILGPSYRRDQVSYRSPQPGHGGQHLHADDVPKLTAGPDTVATAIVTLTDFTTTNGATRLVPGSHRRPDLQRLGGSLTSHRDEVVLACSAGTALVFSGHVLHSGTQNRSADERPALQLVWRV